MLSSTTNTRNTGEKNLSEKSLITLHGFSDETVAF